MSVLGLLNSDIGGDFSFDDLFRQPLCLSQQDDASVHGLGQSHSHGPEPSDGHAHSLSPLSANSSTSGSPDHLRAVDDSDDNTNGTKHTTSTSTSSNGGAAGGSGGTGPSSSVQSPVRSSELTITQRQNARRHVFNASFNILRSLTQCPQAFNKQYAIEHVIETFQQHLVKKSCSLGLAPGQQDSTMQSTTRSAAAAVETSAVDHHHHHPAEADAATMVEHVVRSLIRRLVHTYVLPVLPQAKQPQSLDDLFATLDCVFEEIAKFEHKMHAELQSKTHEVLELKQRLALLLSNASASGQQPNTTKIDAMAAAAAASASVQSQPPFPLVNPLVQHHQRQQKRLQPIHFDQDDDGESDGGNIDSQGGGGQRRGAAASKRIKYSPTTLPTSFINSSHQHDLASFQPQSHQQQHQQTNQDHRQASKLLIAQVRSGSR